MLKNVFIRWKLDFHNEGTNWTIYKAQLKALSFLSIFLYKIQNKLAKLEKISYC